MLPKLVHEHDRKWAQEQISRLPAAFISIASKGYDTALQDAALNEPLEHKKENAGRLAANTRLREYVVKVHEHLKP